MLSMAYAESLMLALAAGAMLAYTRRRWFTAGVLGALAVMTRPNASVLVVAFLWCAVGAVRRGDSRRPFVVRPKDRGPIAYAGLWETWMGPNGEELETAAIVTVPANRALAHLHERMPAIVPPEAFDLWLDCRNVDA